MVSVVRGCDPLPSEFITQMFLAGMAVSKPLSPREDVYKIFLPSGDHTGETLEAAVALSVVKGVTPVPSAFMTQMFTLFIAAFCPSRARVESYAILLPSGDHAEWMLETVSAESLVRGIALEPSAFITQMFAAGIAILFPSRARNDSNAILAPLGDHAGEADEPLVSAVSGFKLAPVESVSHIFVAELAWSTPLSARDEVNTIVPCGETTTILGELPHPHTASSRSTTARLAQWAVISDAVIRLSIAMDLCFVTGRTPRNFLVPVTYKNRRERPFRELSKVIVPGDMRNSTAFSQMLPVSTLFDPKEPSFPNAGREGVVVCLSSNVAHISHILKIQSNRA